MTTLSQTKLAQYRTTAQARQRLAEMQVAERLARATVVAQQAAVLLKERYQVAQVAVFGSLVHPALFHAHSDIDLAVWGLAECNYYRAVGELQALNPEFGIDLIRVEEASVLLQQTLAQESVLL